MERRRTNSVIGLVYDAGNVNAGVGNFNCVGYDETQRVEVEYEVPSSERRKVTCS